MILNCGVCIKKTAKNYIYNNACSIFALLIRVCMILSIQTFRIIAFLEGLSYILLLGIATPVKYLLHDAQYVKLLGMPHGILFIAYVTFALLLRRKFVCPGKDFGLILLASVIPFGTFYIDRKYLKTI